MRSSPQGGYGLPAVRRVTARRASCPAFLFGLVLACGLLLPNETGSLAAGTGTIEGRVVNRATGRPQRGVGVTLRGGAGSSEVATTTEMMATTDAGGRYSFDGLATGEDRIYTIDARFRGGLFAGGAVTLPSDTTEPPVIETRLSVWPTTSSPAAVVIQRDSLFVLPGDGDTGIIESVRLANTSERAYVGRGGGDRRGVSVVFALPAAARLDGLRILDSSLDIPELVGTDLGGFGITVAIPPGITTLTFTYPARTSGGQVDLSRRALYPVLDYRILAEEPLVVESDVLEPDGTVEIQGRDYGRWAAGEELAAGDSLQAVATARAGADPILVGGAVLILVAVGGGVALALSRRGGRRRGAETARSSAGSPSPRVRLVDEIAHLDLSHRAGEITEDDWRAERAELKQRLREIGDEEPEPAS